MEAALDGEHTLNVQAVEMRTGITAETLRTWERRYGWPRPRRLPNGYRVYSEDDVNLILSVKRELDSGVSAATAWQRVLASRERRPRIEPAQAPTQIVRDLYEALVAFNYKLAGELMAQSHAIYPLERVLTEVIQPVLVELGTRWHEGEVSITQEHFATNFLRDNLVTISGFYTPRPGSATILVGSGPGELHDIGALMLAVILRRNRHNVLYLGQNTSIEHLNTSLEELRPNVLLLSASRIETARQLVSVAPMIARMSPPRPMFLFGGRAFSGHPEIAERIGGIYVGGNVTQGVEQIEKLLASNTYGH